MAECTTAAASLVPPSTKATNVFMNIVVNPDGTVTRPEVPDLPPSPEPSTSPSASAVVLSRDVPLDAALGTYLRLYVPANNNPTTTIQPAATKTKLPVILYFHGGGFVLFSPATVFNHGYCEAMAAAVPAVVASLEYRLAPEHRLPAAYDDAVSAVRWLRDGAAQRDPWVAARGDLSRCFLAGSSSGGNVAFFAAVRALIKDAVDDDLLAPATATATVRGLLLHQPYLGGVERTASEARSEDDGMLPLEASDTLWSLALPVGADRDHEFCNPARSSSSLPRDVDVAGLPRCLVTGNTGDPLIDRQREFVSWLRNRGVDVVERTDSAGYHAAELFVREKAQEVFAAVREFVFFADDEAS